MWGLGPTRTTRLPEEGRRREGARWSRQRSRVRLARNPYPTCSEKAFRVRKSREGMGVGWRPDFAGRALFWSPNPLPRSSSLSPRNNMASSSAAPHENLWSSILNSVAQAPAGQRRKNLVVLGEPGAGRSVLVEGLARGGRASRASSLGASHHRWLSSARPWRTSLN